MKTEISAAFPFESKFIEVKGSKIHYIDEGEGMQHFHNTFNAALGLPPLDELT